MRWTKGEEKYVKGVSDYVSKQHNDALFIEAIIKTETTEGASKLEAQQMRYRMSLEQSGLKSSARANDYFNPKVVAPAVPTKRAYNNPRVSKPKALPLVKPTKIRGWQSLKKQCFSLWGKRCAKCSWTPGNNEQHLLHVDHIKPKILYPELADDINNLQPLCHSCNTSKGDREEVDYRPRKTL